MLEESRKSTYVFKYIELRVYKLYNVYYVVAHIFFLKNYLFILKLSEHMDFT